MIPLYFIIGIIAALVLGVTQAACRFALTGKAGFDGKTWFAALLVIPLWPFITLMIAFLLWKGVR